MKQKFLTAEWRKLIMINYEVNPELLKKYTPKGTSLDFWENKTYLSIVGFMFLNTKVLGLKIPFHTNFEEVNLRFYVKKEEKKQTRRGVVFIKEIVPKYAITYVANTLYNENYVSLKMQHDILEKHNNIFVKYAWKYKNNWNIMQVNAENKPIDLVSNSQEEFIAEHYWGYAKGKTQTTEYQVEHIPWQIYPVKNYDLDIDFGALYGKEFYNVFAQKPSSVFLAEGSEIIVRKGKHNKHDKSYQSNS